MAFLSRQSQAASLTDKVHANSGPEIPSMILLSRASVLERFGGRIFVFCSFALIQIGLEDDK
jgi:hypothetical protein